MKKSTEQIDFEIDDQGTIWLAQETEVEAEGKHKIMVSPDQIDLLIEWLQSAKATALERKAAMK